MKQPQQDRRPELFIADLSALNKLYRAVKVYLERPSTATEIAMKSTLQEAEKTFFSQEDRLAQSAEKPRRGLLPDRA
jgi:hypothetical protein